MHILFRYLNLLCACVCCKFSLDSVMHAVFVDCEEIEVSRYTASGAEAL